MLRLLVTTILLCASTTTLASQDYLESVSLKLFSDDISPVAECIIAQSMKTFPDYELVDIGFAKFVETKIIRDQKRFVVVSSLIRHTTTGEMDTLLTRVESLDFEKKWFLIADTDPNRPYLYTRQASLYGWTKREKSDKEYAYYTWLGECR